MRGDLAAAEASHREALTAYEALGSKLGSAGRYAFG